MGAVGGFSLVTWHLPFARTAQAVRINGKQSALKMAEGTAEAPEGELEFLRMFNGVGRQQIMSTLIGRHEWQSVEELESFLAESSGRAQVNDSQSCLMNQLHRRSGGKVRGGRPCPTRQQIPRAQAEVFRRQKPQADHVARNLIGQELADAAFDAEMIDLFASVFAESSKCFHLHGRTLRMKLVEFFFVSRIVR